MGIALISLVSATTVYAGDCLPVDLSELESLDNVVYDIIGNSSNLNGLTIDLNGTIANICTVINYKPDSFTLIFFDNSTKETIIEIEVPSNCPSCKRKTKTITEEVIVEVPNYIDREVEVIKEIEVIKEVPSEPEVIKKVPVALWIVLGILVLLILTSLIPTKKGEEDSNSLQEEIANEYI